MAVPRRISVLDRPMSNAAKISHAEGMEFVQIFTSVGELSKGKELEASIRLFYRYF